MRIVIAFACLIILSELRPKKLKPVKKVDHKIKIHKLTKVDAG